MSPEIKMNEMKLRSTNPQKEGTNFQSLYGFKKLIGRNTRP